MDEDQLSFAGASGLSQGRSSLQEGLARLLEFLVDAPLGAAGVPLNDSAISRLSELLGAGVPVLGGLKALKTVRGAQAAKQPIRAYHGSPHDFDKFSLEKIGTGEGAQAYGHGLYFAEREGVARDYRNRLTQDRRVELDGFDHDKGYGAIDPKTGEMRWFANEKDAKDFKRDAMGRMYEVNIHADPEDFLDWDAPLSQQSEKVRQLARDARMEHNPNVATGQHVYRAAGSIAPNSLSNRMPPGERTPEHIMLQRGIQGIKYYDQGSRAAGQGTRNYVVFDDKLIDIVKKYGIAGAALMLLGERLKYQQPPQGPQ